MLRRCVLVTKCQRLNAWHGGAEWPLGTSVTITWWPVASGFVYTCFSTITVQTPIWSEKTTKDCIIKVFYESFLSSASRMLSEVCRLCFERHSELTCRASLASWVTKLGRRCSIKGNQRANKPQDEQGTQHWQKPAKDGCVEDLCAGAGSVRWALAKHVC